VTIWSFSLIRWRDHGRAAGRVVALQLIAFLAFLAASYPAHARIDHPQVIAVHSASASQVSMVIATPAEQAGEELSPQELSVTVRGRRVPATVTPVASSSLSVALVIDTGGDTPPDVLEAVQSGATEFLLRLPTGARSAVITAGGDPRVVAPLTVEPAAGVTAISSLRPDGARSTAAGAMLAAQELATAPPGPRQVIVFTNGEDTLGPSIEQLTQEVTQAQATTYVVQTSPDHSWAQVVDRSGGAVISSSREQVVETVGQLAKALEQQYLVTFDARTDLPAVAALAVNTGETMFRTLVTLPEAANPTGDAGQSSAPTTPGEQSRTSVALVGLALMTLTVAALVVRVAKHRRGSTRAGTLIARRRAAQRQPAARRLTPTGAPASHAIASGPNPPMRASFLGGARNRTRQHASGPQPEHAAQPPTVNQQPPRLTSDSVFHPNATNAAAPTPLATLLSNPAPKTPRAPAVSNTEQPADPAPNTPNTPSGSDEAVENLDAPTQQQ
jgi:head-tail adaptor